MKHLIYILFTLSAFAVSCVSQFSPELETQSAYLTVNGLVTDENRTYAVRLGVSSPIDDPAAEVPAKKAIVSVSDDVGNSWLFREKKPGYYVSDSLLFTAVQGRSYTLHVRYNGLEYESDPCIISPVPPIEDVCWEKADRPVNASGETEEIVRIGVSTSDPSRQCHYYRWDFDETWEMRLQFNMLPIEKRQCWRSDVSHNILIATTEALTEDRITDLTLTTFNNSTDRGQFKYSILVRQYSISREEYEYWEKVKMMSENTGGIYGITPVSFTGNIRCVTNPEEIALGYFSASGVTTRRIFIKSPLTVPDIYWEYCVDETIPVTPNLPGLNVVVFVLNFYYNDAGPSMWDITSRLQCLDCVNFGSNVKPDYWDEGFSK